MVRDDLANTSFRFVPPNKEYSFKKCQTESGRGGDTE